ncbi:MAG: Gfo/Idh/MocA family oxidoreductase [Armatimonas sp.]
MRWRTGYTMKRRELLTGAAGLGIAETASAAAPVKTMKGVPFERHEKVRIGFVGVGGRGSGLLNDLLNIPGVEIKAICDLRKENADRAATRVERAGQPRPELYTGTETIFEKLCARTDLDLVYNATPWDWHVPIAVSAMEHGHHAAVEVPAANTLKDCWKLVDTSEKTRKHCIQLENCCYGASELMVLQMVKAGLLGDLTHGEAAYIHDLRSLLLADASEGLWRREPHKKRDANLYPTHGLGPVAKYMDIHKGDRFERIVSLSSKEASLTAYRDKTIPAGNPKRAEKYVCGDMNTSIIRTVLGRTIMLQHTVVTPRPYSRLNLIQGTKGAFSDYPARIYLDEWGNDEWRALDTMKEQWEHPLWKKEGDTARKLGGHGGMDYLMSYSLIECMKQGVPPQMDVYDAAAWSAPFPLSELSVKKGGSAIVFPDFTRGNWK